MKGQGDKERNIRKGDKKEKMRKEGETYNIKETEKRKEY